MTLYKFENEHCIKPFRDLYIKHDGMITIYPSVELLNSLGYKELRESVCTLDYNHETQVAVSIFEEHDTYISQDWELQDIQEEIR